MAQAVGGVLGAVVGFAVGGPSGAQWGWAIGAAVGNSFTTIKQPRLGDLAEIRAGEGGPRARVYGTFRPIGGQVVWSGAPREIRTRQRQGKGGPKVESSTLLRSYAIGICEGPITGVSRIWRNNELVYDVRPESEILAESAKWLDGKTILLGGWDQLPHPTIEAEAGAGNAPAMRGTALLVVTDEDLTELRGAIPAYQFETSAGVTIARNSWSYAAAGVSDLNDVAFFSKTGDYLVVRGGADSDAKIFTTRDGVTLSPAFSTASQLVTVVASDDWAVARANGSNVFTSSTGSAWTSGTSASSQSYTVGLWTGARFLFCGFAGSAEYSPSSAPSGWVSSPRPSSADAVVGVVVPASGPGDGVAVVFCSNGTIHRTTNGGASWTTPTVFGDLEPLRRFDSVAYGAGVIRAYKSTSSASWVYSSTDGGATFDCVSYPAFSSAGDIVFSGDQWVMAGRQTTGPTEPVFIRTSSSGLPPFSEVPVDDYPQAQGQLQTRMASGGSSVFVIGILQSGEGFTLTIGVPKLVGTPSDPLPLGLVVESICSDALLDESKRLVDDGLNQQFLYGFATSPEYTAASAIQELSKVFFFDPQDADGRIRFIPRGGDFRAILTEDEFVDGENEPESDTTRDSISVPRLLHLSYFDVAGGQGTDKQFSERQISPRSESPTVLSTPVVLDAETAAKALRIQHQVMEEELRGDLVFGVPDKYIGLTEADTIVAQYRGRSQRARITKVVMNDGWQQLTCLRDRQSAYNANPQAVPPAAVTRPPSTIVGATRFAFLDIPALTQGGDLLGYHIATSGEVAGWRGAAVERQEGGAFSLLATDGTGTVMGTLTSALPLASEWYPDETNVITVQLARADDDLEAIDTATWLSRGNAAAIVRADGTAEIVQFRNAVETSPGVWALSGLQRGRLNTGASAHAIGATFVLLDGALFVQTGSERLASTLTHRAYSVGNLPSSATAQARTWTGRSQREWPPIIESAERAADTVTVTWTPRHRFGSDESPVASSHFDGWQVDATSGGITRTATVLTPTASIDVAGLTNPITVTVRGRNRLAGLGDTATRIIP